ncbi:MAG: hypothetical protein VB111_09905 [Clostridiaceae bacterium]|nr:hypothetical protein [Clostridiaceae bacterium]
MTCPENSRSSGTLSASNRNQNAMPPGARPVIFTMIGGGAHRLLSTVRGALKEGVFREGGELRCYDLDAVRAQVMAEMIQKSPEFRANPEKVTIRWDLTLEQALEGADVVSVTLLAGGARAMNLSSELGWSFGFLGSDNVSYPGAFLALRGAPILLNIARTMERVCPNAILLDFANPVAVLSCMVSTYTKIRCYGVCEGHNNHGYDLTRLLTGKDAYNPDYDVLVAGINHASFIVEGSLHGEDLFALLDRRLAEVENPVELLEVGPYVSDVAREWLRFGLGKIISLYKNRRALLFSGEADGFSHYFHEDALIHHGASLSHDGELLSADAMRTLAAADAHGRADRDAANAAFAAYARRNADDIPWNDPALHLFSVAARGDVQCKVLSGLSGACVTRVAVSAPNTGAVLNIGEGMALEYSHTADRDGLHPIEGLKVPEGVYGMTASLAAHQTLLARACFTRDPRDLHEALLSYPIGSDTTAARELWCRLTLASKETIDPAYQGLLNLLK